MERLYKKFGMKLRTARIRSRLTQEDVAKKVGLSRTSITNIESGRQHIPLHVVYTLASAVGMTPASLLPDELPDQEVISPKLISDWNLAEDEQDWVKRVVFRAGQSTGPKRT